jgi:hypothetical protein
LHRTSWSLWFNYSLSRLMHERAAVPRNPAMRLCENKSLKDIPAALSCQIISNEMCSMNESVHKKSSRMCKPRRNILNLLLVERDISMEQKRRITLPRRLGKEASHANKAFILATRASNIYLYLFAVGQIPTAMVVAAIKVFAR